MRALVLKFLRSRQRAVSPSLPSPSRRPNRWAEFLRTGSGSTLVQFAIVSPVFLLLIFAIMETGIILMTQAMLDNATRDAARQIRIGQVQKVFDTDGTGLFKQTMCADLGNFIPCNSLAWHVQSSSTAFAGLSAAVTTDANGNMTSTGFTPGLPLYYVLVQVGYKRTYLVPWLARIAGSTSNTLLLVSSVAFQNEHYQ